MFGLNFVFFAHTMNIAEIGFNPTLNQILISLAELAYVPFAFFFVNNIKRKLTSIIALLAMCIFSIITYFIIVPPNCELCSQVYFQMTFILLTRFLVMGQYSLSIINFNEAYPVSILAIAAGWLGTLSTVGATLSYIIFSDVSQVGINPFLLSGILFLMLGASYIWIP